MKLMKKWYRLARGHLYYQHPVLEAVYHIGGFGVEVYREGTNLLNDDSLSVALVPGPQEWLVYSDLPPHDVVAEDAGLTPCPGLKAVYHYDGGVAVEVHGGPGQADPHAARVPGGQVIEFAVMPASDEVATAAGLTRPHRPAYRDRGPHYYTGVWVGDPERQEDSVPTVYWNAGDLPLGPSLEVRRLSPAGFNWGRPGPGADQLALAILQVEVGTERAVDLYEEFGRGVIARLPVPMQITSADVAEWLATRQWHPYRLFGQSNTNERST